MLFLILTLFLQHNFTNVVSYRKHHYLPIKNIYTGMQSCRAGGGCKEGLQATANSPTADGRHSKRDHASKRGALGGLYVHIERFSYFERHNHYSTFLTGGLGVNCTQSPTGRPRDTLFLNISCFPEFGRACKYFQNVVNMINVFKYVNTLNSQQFNMSSKVCK